MARAGEGCIFPFRAKPVRDLLPRQVALSTRGEGLERVREGRLGGEFRPPFPRPLPWLLEVGPWLRKTALALECPPSCPPPFPIPSAFKVPTKSCLLIEILLLITMITVIIRKCYCY